MKQEGALQNMEKENCPKDMLELKTKGQCLGVRGGGKP